MKKAMFNSLLPLLLIISSLGLIQSGDGNWQTVKTKNPASGRSECGMAACNGKRYLMGGGDLPVDVFDPVTNTWTGRKKAPVDMNHFQPVTYQNKIYVLEAFTAGYIQSNPT